ncbi:MAG: phosphoribosylanthranilate isomerase [Melioribacteraceae bacterium]|nr:phosphoribosylanthranilate isomerase [Melioribacteraceae bacterium]
MKIKICGITNLEDALFSVECGADALGFVFYKQSKRYIEPIKAKEIISQLSPFIFSVGVFVNEDPEIVNEIAFQTKLNTVQLHGDEDINYIKKIFVPVIKTLRIDSNFNWNILDNYSTNILLDTYKKNEYGGTGIKFDWKLIPKQFLNRIILSGGIDLESLPIIINDIKPAAIDLSSSIELHPGKKDHKKVKNFFSTYKKLTKALQ